MAPPVYRNHTEAKAFLCHVWISVSCIIFAAVFFGVSVINKAFIFAGAFFLVLSLLIFCSYFLCRRRERKEGGCFGDNAQGQCCFYCCDSCIRTMFCLGPRLVQPRSPSSRMALHSAVTHREMMMGASNGGYDNFAIARPASTHFPPSYSLPDRRAELRGLETEIHELLMDCSRIQEQLNGERGATTREWSLRRSDRELVNIHDSLSTEFGLLSSWIEGSRDIPLADVERMRSGLHNLRRRLRLIENGVTARPISSHESALQPQLGPLRDSIVGMASLTAPLPPIVHHPVRTTDISGGPGLPPPYQEYDAPQSTRMEAGRFELIGRPDSNHFRLPYYLMPPPVAPPVDESGAPPSYEEASSSQV